MHGDPKRVHGLRVWLAQQGESVDVDQLVVLSQATVAGRSSSEYHIFNKDTKVDRAWRSIVAAARLAFNTNTWNKIVLL